MANDSQVATTIIINLDYNYSHVQLLIGNNAFVLLIDMCDWKGKSNFIVMQVLFIYFYRYTHWMI